MLIDKIRTYIQKNFVYLIVLIAVFAGGIYVGQNFQFSFKDNRPSIQGKLPKTILNKDQPAAVNADFSLFWDAWEKVTSEHLQKDKIDPNKLVYGAINGFIQAIGDPYTTFLPPDQNKDFQNELDGYYEGVGIQIGYKDKSVVVISPLDATPAQKAGVKAGEEILKVDDKSIQDKTLGDIVSLIRGKAGTSVKIGLRKTTGETYDITLTRERIKVKSVILTPKDNHIALIRVSRFGTTTDNEWDSVVSQVITDNYKGIVLDLRDNPGGELVSGIHIAGEFLKASSVILMQENAQGVRTSMVNQRDGKLLDIPVVVLVNGGSASASEIVTGALRDNGRAKLVGEKTFGKGTVQEVQELDKGAGLHITTSKWLTPNGSWVNNNGLEPDFKVVVKEEDLKAQKDAVLDKAIEVLNVRP